MLDDASGIATSDSINGILNIVCVKYKIVPTTEFPSMAGGLFLPSRADNDKPEDPGV